MSQKPVKPSVLPLCRCLYCPGQQGTFSINVPVALSLVKQKGPLDVTGLLARGSKNSESQAVPCPHTTYLSVEVSFDETDGEGWRDEIETYLHPLVSPTKWLRGEEDEVQFFLARWLSESRDLPDDGGIRHAVERPFHHLFGKLVVPVPKGQLLFEAALLTTRDPATFMELVLHMVRDSTHYTHY